MHDFEPFTFYNKITKGLNILDIELLRKLVN